MRNAFFRSLPLVLLLHGCSPDPGSTRIIAHGGAGSDHPPNSREALLHALAIGAHGIEMDVQLTADSVLVLFHDQYLDEISTCKGLINSSTWKELKACRVPNDGKQTSIERADSLLLEAAALYPEAEFALDCKLFAHGEWWPYLETFSRALARLHDKSALRGKLVIECMVDDFLLLVQRKRPGLALSFYTDDPQKGTMRAVASHYSGITLHHRHISAGEVRYAQGLGLKVTLVSPGDRWGHWRTMRKRPDRIQTDRPGSLLSGQGAFTN